MPNDDHAVRGPGASEHAPTDRPPAEAECRPHLPGLAGHSEGSEFPAPDGAGLSELSESPSRAPFDYRQSPVIDSAAPNPAATPTFAQTGGDYSLFPAPPMVPIARPLAAAYAAQPPYPADPFLLLDVTQRAAWADLAFIIAAMLAIEFLTFLGVQIWLVSTGQMPIDEAPSPELMQRIMGPVLGLRAAAACIIVALLVKARRLSAGSVGLKKRSFFVDTLLGVAATPVAYLAIIMTILGVYLLWPRMWHEMQQNAEQLTNMIPALSPLGYFIIAMVIGVYEELLFRGFLMTRLRRATSSWLAAVLLTTAVFTVLHAFDQTKGALIVIAVLSLFFSLLTVWRRSIVPAIIAHALFDFTQFLGLQYTGTASPPPLPT